MLGRALKIKWKSRWRRVNYDLHNVLGFYITSFAIVLALTGLSFSFQWVRKGISSVANLGQVYTTDHKEYKSDTAKKINFPDSANAIDRALAIAMIKSPGSNSFLMF